MFLLVKGTTLVNLPVTPDCTQFVDGVSMMFMADATGSLVFDEAIPSSAAMLGVPLFEQVAVMDPVLGVRWGNYARQIIGDRSC